MSSVFISYSHTDREMADEIVATLARLKIKSYRDTSDIKWGDPINSKVREGIRESSAILVIVSPNSLTSLWVAFEVGFGIGANKRILPYLTDQSLKLPSFLSDLTFVDSVEKVHDFFATEFGLQQSETQSVGSGPELNQFECDYLRTIGRSTNNGEVNSIVHEFSGRDAARYQDAVTKFESLGLLRNFSGIYKLTKTGWNVTDKLWGLAILNVLEVDEPQKAADVARTLELTDGENDLNELNRHFETLKTAGYITSYRSNSGTTVRLTQKGATARKHGEIDVRS